MIIYLIGFSVTLVLQLIILAFLVKYFDLYISDYEYEDYIMAVCFNSLLSWVGILIVIGLFSPYLAIKYFKKRYKK